MADLMTVQNNIVQGEHKCKSHEYAHFYVRHTCGHEFCPYSWLYCPRCTGSHAENHIQDGFEKMGIRWPKGLQNY